MANPKCCLLMDLPPELRNLVYEHLLIPGGGSDSDDDQHVRIHYNNKLAAIWKPPSILQTSRQIRREASPMYYSSQTFRISVNPVALTKPLLPWLSTLSPKNRGMLGTIQLDLEYDFESKAKNALQFFYDSLAAEGCEIRRDVLYIKARQPCFEPLNAPIFHYAYGMYYEQSSQSTLAYVWTNVL